MVHGQCPLSDSRQAGRPMSEWMGRGAGQAEPNMERGLAGRPHVQSPSTVSQDDASVDPGISTPGNGSVN